MDRRNEINPEIAPAQYNIYVTIVEFIRHKLTYPIIPEVAEAAHVSVSAATLTIEMLERKGLIETTMEEYAPMFLDGIPKVRFRSRRRWRMEHPEEMREVTDRRIKFSTSKFAARKRAKAHKATGDHHTMDLEQMYKSQKGLCWWCGKPLPKDFHIDHRVPFARGGTNDPGNLCCACPECNIAKHDKMPWEFCGRLL